MDGIHRMAEQQAREMENARRKGTEETVQGRMTPLDVSQEWRSTFWTSKRGYGS